MTQKIALGLAVAFLVGCAGCSTPQKKNDMALLQGTWQGTESGHGSGGACTLTISGNTLDFRGADSSEWYKGTFTLREGTKPKQLTGMIGDCPAPEYVGKTVNAIYRLEDGSLTLTGNEPGNPQPPDNFDAPGSRKFVLRKL